MFVRSNARIRTDFPTIQEKPQNFPNMDKGLHIHIGTLPNTLFAGAITPLEVFLVDGHNSVATGYSMQTATIL